MKSMIREQLEKRLGILVARADAFHLPFKRLAEELARREVDVVVDIGANDGGFAGDLLGAGYRGRIVSIEPLPDARRALLIRAAAHDRWTVGPAVAVGDGSGSAVFNVAGNSASSSLMTMSALHATAAPGSATIAAIEVQVRTLDEIWPALAGEGERAYVKIDVQGAELRVLSGGQRAFRERVVGLQLEMSIDELYLGQPLWRELDAEIRRLGFELWDIVPGFRDIRTKRLLQFDGVYFRE